MMLWWHPIWRRSRKAPGVELAAANFRLWAGSLLYCLANALCWVFFFVMGGDLGVFVYMGIVWGIGLPAAAAVALLVFKLRSRKASFSWGAYATVVATLAAMGWANLRFVINSIP